ncbi:MAG TPA: DUF1257 domain-containing protein [Pirellulaceae bacterium]|jgi:hypothetical protein|nr:DUF1257 domain-containing protein [Pirellulaceae bacterium]
MSHIVTIRTEVRDVAAVHAACRRLGLAHPAHETVPLFSGERTGYAVRLPAWRYPIVCDLAQGTLAYDDYEGRWGERAQLDRFLQAYAIERATLEARKRGYGVVEQPLEDGSIRLTIEVGDAA